MKNLLPIYRRLTIAILLVVLGTVSSYAATVSYVGPTGSGAWATGTNWSTGSVPGSGDDVTISVSSTTNINNVPTISLHSLTISGSSTLTLSSSSTSLLTLATLTISGNLTTSSTVNLAVTDGSIASGKILNIGSSRTLTISGTLTAAGSTPFSGSNGTITINSGGLINYTGASVTSPSGITVAVGGELRFSGSGNPIVGSPTINGTLTLGGTVNTASGTTPTWGAASTLVYAGTSAQTANYYELPSSNGPFNVTINNSAGVSFNTSIAPDPVIKGTLTLQSGTLTLSNASSYPQLTFTTGDVPIVKVNGTINPGTTATIVFGTVSATAGAAFTLPDNLFTASPTIYNMTVYRTNPITLNNQDITVSTFQLSQGLVNLGTGSVTVGSTGGSPSVTNMLVTSASSGYVKHTFTTSGGGFVYPIGESTGTTEYSKVDFYMNSNSVSRTVGFKVIDAVHPQMNTPTTPNHYLSRYWTSTVSSTTGTYNWDADFYYNGTSGDIVGTEANITAAAWNGSSDWNSYPGSINTSSNYVSVTGATQGTGPLGYDHTGRLPALSNDDPCGAVTLTPGSTCNPTTGNIVGATQTFTGCIGTANDDSWFKFTATSTSHTVQVTGSSSFDPVVQAYYQSACGSITSTSNIGSCTDATGTGGTESLVLTGLTPGLTYYVRVYDYSSGTPSTTTFSICVLTPPANDEPCGAVVLTPNAAGSTTCASPVTGDVNLASQTYSAGSCSFISTARDVWYKFTATATSHTVTVTGNGTFDAVVQAYTATNCSTSVSAISGACVDATGTGGTETMQMNALTVGTTYYVRVHHASSTVPTNTTFTICVLTAPSNNEPCGAVALTPNAPGSTTCSSPVTGDVALASQTYSAGSCSFISTANDVWYKFVATATSHTVTVTGNGTFDAVVQAYTATNCSTAVTTISGACVDATGTGGTETMQLTALTVGTTYYVRVHHASSTVPTNTTFTICILTAPSNDEPCGAISLTPNTTCTPTTGNVALASQTYSAGSCSFITTARDVWYKFTATNTSHTVSVTGNGTFDPVIQAYTATNCSTSVVTISGSCVDATGAGGTETKLLTGLTIGVTYYVRVHHASSTVPSNTSFTICIITPPPAPSNDECVGSINLPVNASCTSPTAGTTVSATNSGLGSDCGNAIDDVWYTFTCPANGSVHLEVTGTGGFNPSINLRNTSNCPSSGATLLCYDYTNGNQTETMNVTGLTGNAQYRVRIFGSGGTSGTFNVCASSSYTPAGNDNVSGAITANVGNTLGNNNSNYGLQIGEPTGLNWLTGDATNSQWFVFTPTTTGCYRVASTGFDTQLAIYTATNTNNFGSFTEVASDDDGGGANYTSLISSVTLTAGTAYYMQVNGFPYTIGTPTLSITILTPAAPVAIAATNDSCSSFTANWNAAANATGYRLDVATDNNFTNMVAGYNDLDVANVTTYNITGLSSGVTYYYRVRAYGACSNTIFSANSNTITVTTTSGSQGPPFTHGSSLLCVGQTETYTASGTNVRYTILQGVGATVDSITGVVTNVVSNFTIRATATSNCGTGHTDNLVAVLALPTRFNVTGGGAICSGNSVSIGLDSSQNNVTYQLKSGGNNIGAPVTGTNNAIAFGTFNTAGTYIVEASITGIGCTDTMTGSAIITVGTPPTANITAGGPTTFCQGDSVVLSANTGAGYTYQWYNGANIIGGATASTYSALATGSYSVSITNSGCSTASNSIAVTVTTAPTASITAGGPTNFCQGGSVVLSATTGTGYTYQWLESGNPINLANASTYTATASGVYSVEVTGGACSATSTTIAVSVGTAPTASITAGGPTTFCQGDSVVLSATTGTGYAYQWLESGNPINLANASTYTALASGTYSVSVTNSGCSATSNTVSVTANAAPTASITAGGPTNFCQGGSVVLSATTGTGYTYQWLESGNPINLANASTYTAIASGVYSVSVTNGTCSATSNTITVNVGTAPTASITAGGPTTFCQGDSVVLSATTGTGYTYQWLESGNPINLANASTYTALASGTYSVSVTNSGCSATSNTVSVTANAAPTASITAGGPTNFCQGGSVVLSAATGTGYTYQWLESGNPINLANASTYSATASGVYSVSVTNGTCSTTSNTITVNVGTAPTASITAGGSTTFCSGDSVILSATTGTGYTYQWLESGNPINLATASTYTVTTSGNYSVSVTNSGCSATSNSIAVTVNPAPTAGINASGSLNFCQGDSVILMAATGTGYTYQWYNGANLIGSATAANYTALTSGVYSVSVTNGSCSATSNVLTVNVGTAPTANITAGGSTTFCSGDSVILSATTGTGYTYQWLESSNPINLATASTYTALTSGTYSVSVTNSGCSATSNSIAVTVNPAPTAGINASGSLNFCQGDSVILMAATGTGYTYQWYNGANLIGSATAANYTALTSGVYSVSVTNGSCSATSNALTVNVGTAPTASITAGGSTTFCSGDSVVLSATTGTGYSYQWLESGNPINLATASTYTVTTSGNYSVSVTNSGCSATSNSIAVTVNPAPTAGINASGSLNFCQGDSVILMAATGTGYTYQWYDGANLIGSATAANYTALSSGVYSVSVTNGSCSATSNALTVNVGTAPTANITAGGSTTFCSGDSVILSATTGTGYTYQWLESGNPINLATASTYTVTTSGNYSVSVTNSGCSATSNSIAVTVNWVPDTVITASGPLSFCPGGSVTLNAPAGTVYQWSTTETSSSITATTSGTYKVTVTNAWGCSVVSQSVVVSVSNNPVATVTPSGSTTFCQGDSVTLTSSSGVSYAWSTTETSSAITVHQSGTYSVTVDLGNNCTAISAPLQVTVNTTPIITISAGGATTFCQGDSVTLTASSGNGYNYQWLESGSILGISTVDYVVNTSGTYAVFVTDANGCSNTSSDIAVTVNPLPTISVTASGATTICQGDTVTLTANPATGLTYQWLKNNGNINNANTGTLDATTSGSYKVFVTDANGCSNTSSTTAVTVNPIPTANVTAGGPLIFCQGGQVILNATTGTGYSYQWQQNGSDITNANTGSYTATAAGTYTVNVTDSNGCGAASSNTVVVVNAGPSVTFVLSPDTVCLQSAAFALTGGLPTGGTYTGNGVATGQFTAATAGVGLDTLSYTFSDTNGCSSTASALMYVDICPGINEVDAMNFSVFPNPTDGQLTLQGSGISGMATLEIHDMLGVVVFSKNIHIDNATFNETLDLKTLAGGVYVLNVKSNSTNVFSKKIIRN